jgi:hypothetical protein
MRKIGILVFCVSFCLAVAVILPQVGVAYKTFDDAGDNTGCRACHDADYPDGAIHSKHSSCDSCHDVTGDTPVTSNCIVCHPMGDTGKCPLVNYHPADSCTPCHDSECEDTPETTTTVAAETTTTVAAETTTTVATQPCPTEAIYGEDSEEVDILRYFRDATLSTTPEGQEMIRLYYQWSPALTRAIQNDEAFGKRVKEITDRVLLMITKGAQ